MDFLNYHHLRYFWAVAKYGSLRRAAEALGVSQPTMSAQIQSLEDSFGEKLYRRGGRGLVLTEAGHRVFKYAEEIFTIGQELVQSVKEQSPLRPLRVHIGIADSLPKLVSYRVMKPIFHLPQPVQAVCREGKIDDLLGQLAAYRLDIVLADEPAPSSINIKVFNHLLGESGVTFCGAAKLTASLKGKFPACLDGAPALLPAAQSVFRRSLEKFFLSKGIRPNLVAEFEDPALMKAAADDGLGFLPICTVVAREAMESYNLCQIGRTRECTQQFYAISAERKLTHAAVVAMTRVSMAA